MANQGQQGNQGGQGNQGQQSGERQKDRESNLGHSGSDMDRPAGTSGQQSERTKDPARGNQKNQDEEDAGIGNRNTNR